MKIQNNLNFTLSTYKTQNSQKIKDSKNYIFEKIKEVDKSQKEALHVLEALAKGEDIDLSEAVLILTKADIEFKLLLRVRNKIIEAYQEIMRMQV